MLNFCQNPKSGFYDFLGISLEIKMGDGIAVRLNQTMSDNFGIWIGDRILHQDFEVFYFHPIELLFYTHLMVKMDNNIRYYQYQFGDFFVLRAEPQNIPDNWYLSGSLIKGFRSWRLMASVPPLYESAIFQWEQSKRESFILHHLNDASKYLKLLYQRDYEMFYLSPYVTLKHSAFNFFKKNIQKIPPTFEGLLKAAQKQKIYFPHILWQILQQQTNVNIITEQYLKFFYQD